MLQQERRHHVVEHEGGALRDREQQPQQRQQLEARVVCCTPVRMYVRVVCARTVCAGVSICISWVDHARTDQLAPPRLPQTRPQTAGKQAHHIFSACVAGARTYHYR